MNNNLLLWLEQDIPPATGQPDPMGGGSPMGQPGNPTDPMGTGAGMQVDPRNTMNPPPQEETPDVSQDPQVPDMPDTSNNPPENFEDWKKNYFKESIKGDPNTLIDLINSVRDEELEPQDRKFVEDNLQVNFLRNNANILTASKEIRNEIKKEIDQTHPATALVQHITRVLEKTPLMNEIYIKFNGLMGAKGDYHRKFVASLIGGVQVGSGGNTPDVIFNDRDYSIQISTRFNARFGDIVIGKWSLLEDDPKKYLRPPELARLDRGSPEEKDVLRRRIVMESIAEQFLQRAFLINVVSPEGTIYHLGWDLGNSLKTAYTDGRLIVRTKESENSEAIIDDDGAILPSLDWYIRYVRETGEIDEEGNPDIEEVEFLERKDGQLFLIANLDIIKEASTTLQGLVFKEVPYQGNPADLLRIERCVPSAPEVLLRQC